MATAAVTATTVVDTSGASSSAAGTVDLTLSDSDSNSESESTGVIEVDSDSEDEERSSAPKPSIKEVIEVNDIEDEGETMKSAKSASMQCKKSVSLTAAPGTATRVSLSCTEARVSLSPLTTSRKFDVNAPTAARDTSLSSKSTLGSALCIASQVERRVAAREVEDFAIQAVTHAAMQKGISVSRFVVEARASPNSAGGFSLTLRLVLTKACDARKLGSSVVERSKHVCDAVYCLSSDDKNLLSAIGTVRGCVKSEDKVEKEATLSSNCGSFLNKMSSTASGVGVKSPPEKATLQPLSNDKACQIVTALLQKDTKCPPVLSGVTYTLSGNFGHIIGCEEDGDGKSNLVSFLAAYSATYRSGGKISSSTGVKKIKAANSVNATIAPANLLLRLLDPEDSYITDYSSLKKEAALLSKTLHVPLLSKSARKKQKSACKKQESAGKKLKSAAGGKKQESAGKKKSAGKKQKSACKKQESAGKKQESAGKKQESPGKKQGKKPAPEEAENQPPGKKQRSIMSFFGPR